MSLIVTVHTNEGIVMASDSRTTFSRQGMNPLPDGKGTIITQLQGVHYSDTTYKTFLVGKYIGVSTCGAAAINGKPIAGYVEDFINNKVGAETSIQKVSEMILDSFRLYEPIPDIVFHVAGYEQEDNDFVQKFYRVFVANNTIEKIETSSQGAAWNGETEILSRIITPYWQETISKDGNKEYIKQTPPTIPWNFFSLQDAIDFSMYAMNTTIETMRFQERLKTVGGPIDVLAIKPTGSNWIKRKKLHI